MRHRFLERPLVCCPLLVAALLVVAGVPAGSPDSVRQTPAFEETGPASPAGGCPDTDGDGVCDPQDNCVDVPNPHQGPPRYLSGSLASVAWGFDRNMSPDGSTLVFEAYGPPWGLYSVPIDGGTPVQLNGPLVSQGEILDWVVSPDSSTVVYRADQDVDEVDDLYSVPIGGGVTRKLTLLGSAGVNTYDISADSSTVVYRVSLQQAVPDIYSVPIGGGFSTKLNVPLDPGTYIGTFRLTPDGTTVVYSIGGTGDYVLYSVPIGGGPSVFLDERVKSSVPFVISADSATVVYVSQAGASEDLVSVPVAGGIPTQLNDPPVNGSGVIYRSLKLGAGGSRVVYRATHDAPGVYELYSARLDGGGSTKLSAPLVTGGDVGQGWFYLSADGNRVVYRADQEIDEVHELYSVPIDGGPVTKLNGPLVGQTDVKDIRVSPSSPYVIYAAYQADLLQWALYSVPVGGGPYTPIADEYDNPAISPDGTFVVDRTGQGGAYGIGNELYRVSITGGAPLTLNAPLPPETGVGYGLRITPDSSKIAFVADGNLQGTPYKLYATDLDPAGADVDEDGYGGACDCDDLDGLLGLPPSEVVDVTLAGASPTWIHFGSQEATSGASTSYDVVAGDLPDLLESGIYAAASCVGSFDDTPAFDSSPGPAPGTGRYYLVRARNGCAVGGTGTFGDSTLLADPRDDLDANGPCP